MAKNNASRFGLRPTLIVGLGGTGHEVLVRLKARYLDTYGEEIFKIIKMFVFDTAEETKDAPTETGELIQLDRSTELIHIGNVPTTNILQNLDRHETIKAWLPPNLPTRAITAGAQQVRPMGRLALFNRFSLIKSRLDQAIRALSNINLRGEIGQEGKVERTEGLNIFIVASVCGGTGSGIFIDMAYILRQLCKDQGVEENYCFVNGVLVLPQAFAAVSNDAIYANAYAALLELDHFTHKAGFSVAYPGEAKTFDSLVRPFNICYLVDAVNERGKMLAGLNELAPMVAEAIFLQTASQVGEANKNNFDNVKALSGLDRDYPTAYSGLGTASLVFPVDVLIDACAARYGVNLLQKRLAKPLDPAGKVLAAEEVNAVMEKLRLSEDVLKLEMGRGQRGRTLRIHLDGQQLEQVPVRQLVETAVKRVQYEEDRTLSYAYQQITHNHERLVKQMSETLVKEVNRIVDDPNAGLEIALAFLKALDNRLSAMVAAFTARRDQLETQARHHEANNNGVQELLVQATTSFFIGRKGRTAKARDSFVSHHNHRLNALLEKHLLSLAIELLATLSDDVVRAQAQTLETLYAKLQAAQDRLDRLARALASGKSRALNPLTYEITTADDVETYYRHFARDLDQELPRLFEQQGPLHTWTDRGYEALYDLLLDFGRSLFAGVRQVDIEQVIMDKRDQATPEMRLEELREDSIPFWNRDLTRMSDGGTTLEHLIVLGVPDKTETIYKETRQGESLASTHDRHGVTLLTTRHGLTIYALQQFDDYKGRYERHQERQVSPLHCFDVGNTRWMKTIFALGQTFDHIKREGNRFVICLPAEYEILREKIELGMGLQNALYKFVSVGDYSDQVEKSVNDYINQIGLENARRAVESYIKAPASKSPNLQEIERELKLLALEYKNEYLG